MSEIKRTTQAQAIRRTAAVCGVVVGLMLGASYAAVPLYDLFCRTTGYGGTTQRIAKSAVQPVERTIRIMFDANVDPKLPWTFTPDQQSVTVRLGEVAQVSYHARNNSPHRITGMAAFNVTPYALGPFFNKVQCFCFNEQTLEPGQEVLMPVIFYVDPAMVDDSAAHSITTATLSYTFYESANPAKVASRP
jgi:cytochrome c oxidase assembly protein subunit 11